MNKNLTPMLLVGMVCLASCTSTSRTGVNPELAPQASASPEQDSLPNVVPPRSPKPEWIEKASARDRQRLANWQSALEDGRVGAIKGGFGSEIAARSPLFESDIALFPAELPDGLYSCSITKLDKNDDNLPYVAYSEFRCRITKQGERHQLIKLTGSQRTTGWIYPDNKWVGIYLGTLFYGYEDKALSYGDRAERDQVAVVQGIGGSRWRIVFPQPYYESIVDVMELRRIGD